MMRLWRICTVFAFFLLSFAPVACTGSAERQGVEAAVKGYNTALMKSFAAMDFEALKEVTTEREHRKVSIYIMSYAGQDERLNARLLKLAIKKIRVHGNNADAVTSEQWEYERVHTKTGEAVTPKTLYAYEMQYMLLKDKDRWKVDGLKIIKESRDKS